MIKTTGCSVCGGGDPNCPCCSPEPESEPETCDYCGREFPSDGGVPEGRGGTSSEEGELSHRTFTFQGAVHWETICQNCLKEEEELEEE